MIVSADSKGLSSWTVSQDGASSSVNHAGHLSVDNVLTLGGGTESNILSISLEGEMRVFSSQDAADGSIQCVATSTKPEAVCSAVMLPNHNGQLIASVSESDKVSLYSLSHGSFTLQQEHSIPSESLTHLAASPDSSCLAFATASGRVGLIKLDQSSGGFISHSTYNTRFSKISAIAVTSSIVMIGTEAGEIIRYSPGELLTRQSNPHSDKISALFPAKNGIVSAGWDGKLFLWPASSGAPVERHVFSSPITCLAVSGDRVVTGHCDKKVLVTRLSETLPEPELIDETARLLYGDF